MPVVGDGSFTVSAAGGASGNAATFSVAGASAGGCSAGGTNGATISILTTGTCTVRANQLGDATYSAAPQQSLDMDIGGVDGRIFADGFQ